MPRVFRSPWADGDHGPLPGLLLALTVVTGLVDAVGYVALGHVFVANMTGNVVFLGFALAGVPGVSVLASLTALGAFLVGAVAGGRIGVRIGDDRARHLRAATLVMIPPMLVAAIVGATVGDAMPTAVRYVLIVLIALAMGAQNATARRLSVPDLTTTVLTLTLTGVAADSRLAGGPGGRPARRLLPIGAMLVGALIGAVLVLHVHLVVPLVVAAAILVATALIVHRQAAGSPSWTHSR